MTSAPAGALPGSSSERRPSLVGIGTVVWLASELMFFSGLFAAWFTLHASTDPWPPTGTELATARTGVATAVLVVSSFTAHAGVVAARRDDRRGAVRWLVLTAVLGAVFLGNQGLEYAELSFDIGSHSFGSIFYLMTGFHGLHVLAGIVLLLVTGAVIAGDDFRAPAEISTDVASYYWHFVDVVWVAMYSTIYLLG